MAGSAVAAELGRSGCNIVTRGRDDLDLTDQAAVRAFFAAERPRQVVLAAARVGGIIANSTYPAEFIRENLAIQTNVIHESWRAGVERLVFLGSSCIYPRNCPQPIREEYLLTGPLEFTNRPYAIAKIAGVEMCWAYNRQYGARFIALMPTNLYGPGDSFDLQNSHVLPALVRRIHLAKRSGASSVTLWGSGSPMREFLHSWDAARAVTFVLGLPEDVVARLCTSVEMPPLLNVGCGTDLTIRELAGMVCSAVGFEGEIVWDRSKPDGTPRKLLDVSRLTSLGWSPSIDLQAGIRELYAHYLSRYPEER